MKDKRLYRILMLARDEGCNTSADIANALGITVAEASAHISDLIDQGMLRRTGQIIRNGNPDNSGQPYRVFEPALSASPSTEQT